MHSPWIRFVSSDAAGGSVEPQFEFIPKCFDLVSHLSTCPPSQCHLRRQFRSPNIEIRGRASMGGLGTSVSYGLEPEKKVQTAFKTYLSSDDHCACPA